MCWLCCTCGIYVIIIKIGSSFGSLRLKPPATTFCYLRRLVKLETIVFVCVKLAFARWANLQVAWKMETANLEATYTLCNWFVFIASLLHFSSTSVCVCEMGGQSSKENSWRQSSSVGSSCSASSWSACLDPLSGYAFDDPQPSYSSFGCEAYGGDTFIRYDTAKLERTNSTIVDRYSSIEQAT